MGATSNEVKNRYNAKAYDVITLKVKKGDRQIIQEEAAARGMSTNEFIRYCINEIMGEKITNMTTNMTQN